MTPATQTRYVWVVLFVHKNQTPSAPIVVSVPHAGTCFPAETIQTLATSDPIILRQDSDLYVHELFQAAIELDLNFIATPISRYVIDLNRNPQDTNSAFVAGAPTIPNPKFLGLVAHKTTLGEPLLARVLNPDELTKRIANYHSPYIQTLEELVAICVKNFGFCIHIDAHSMPSKAALGHDDTGAVRADIVPGDLNGKSCSPKLTKFVSDFFENHGLSVSPNIPYAGAFISQHFGNPSQGVHTLQIELNRKLYMNEQTKEKIPDRFAILQNQITALLMSLKTFKV